MIARTAAEMAVVAALYRCRTETGRAATPAMIVAMVPPALAPDVPAAIDRLTRVGRLAPGVICPACRIDTQDHRPRRRV